MGIVCAKATATAAADTSSCIPSPPGSATGIDDPASPTYHDLATGPYGIIFTTYDGLWQSSRQSPVATSTPTGVAAVDPSLYPAHNRSTEILGVFQANEVLNYAPLDGSTVSVH